MLKKILTISFILSALPSCKTSSQLHDMRPKNPTVTDESFHQKPQILCSSAADCMEKGNEAMEQHNLEEAWVFYQSGCQEGAIRICEIANRVRDEIHQSPTELQYGELRRPTTHPAK